MIEAIPAWPTPVETDNTMCTAPSEELIFSETPKIKPVCSLSLFTEILQLDSAASFHTSSSMNPFIFCVAVNEAEKAGSALHEESRFVLAVEVVSTSGIPKNVKKWQKPGAMRSDLKRKW